MMITVYYLRWFEFFVIRYTFVDQYICVAAEIEKSHKYHSHEWKKDRKKDGTYFHTYLYG